MLKKEIYTPLSAVLPDKKTANKEYLERIEIIISEEIPVLCRKNTTGKLRLMPFKVLYDNDENFWKKKGIWDYFLTEEGLGKLNVKLASKKPLNLDYAKATKTVDEQFKNYLDEIEQLEAHEELDDEIDDIEKMSSAQKMSHINKSKERLNDLLHKNADEQEVIETLSETIRDAIIINHSYVEEAVKLDNTEAKKYTQELVDNTTDFVKIYNSLLHEDINSNNLMNTIQAKTNGTIIQHMAKVYNMGASFLAYYDKLVSSSSAIQRIRVAFPSRYRKLYYPLLSHLDMDDITLERVFLGGLRAISPEFFHNWSIGFFVHDIGKASAVEYHEGKFAYDRTIIIDHVKLGFNYIMNKTNYPREAGLIAGYHHEYYGSPDGYGYFRAYLGQYKKQNPEIKQNYCITFEIEPILDFKAIAYFPAKALEIIDIFDSVTDPNRVYHKPMSQEEALVMMREEFVEKHLKIDPILFDIFTSFIRNKRNKVAA